MQIKVFQSGFTLVELIMTIVILGIIAVVAIPRFLDNNAFQTRGFADQVQASLRYAQKVAIAQHRFVCTSFTVNSVALSTGTTAACGTPMDSLSEAGNYVIAAPTGITFASVPTNFSFNALGSPSVAQTINITGASNAIIIESETGYVHQ